MKIILTTPLFSPEIAEPAPYARKVSSILADSHEITVLTYSNVVNHSVNPRLISIFKNQSTPQRIIKYFFRLLKESKGCDFLYAQGGISTSLASALASLFWRKPLIFRFNEDEVWERSKRLGICKEDLNMFLKSKPNNFKLFLIKHLQNFVLKKSTAIIVPSKYFLNLICRYYHIPLKNIKIIYNPAPKEFFIPLACEKKPKQIFASAEYLSKEDLDKLINVCAELIEEFPDLKLKISGHAHTEELNRFNFIDWLGICGEAENFFHLKTSTIHVVNSSINHNPDVLFAGLQANAATICSNIDGLNEGLVNNESGLLLGTGEAEELKLKIKSIFLNEALKNKLQNGGRLLLKNKFSWGAHIKELENIFHE